MMFFGAGGRGSRVARHRGDSEADLRRRIAAAPGDVDLRRRLAEMLAADGRGDEAAHLLRLAETAERVAADRSAPELAAVVAELARDHIRAGAVDAAARLAAVAAAWRRGTAVLVPNMRFAAGDDAAAGEALRRDGKGREAEALLLRALARRPDDAATLRSLSALYRDDGRLEEALTLARLALVHCPDAPWGHVQLGNVLARLGRAALAVAAYRSAQALDTRLPGVAAAVADQLGRLGDLAGAAAAAGLAAAEVPDDADAARRAAALWERAGRPAEAVVWYRRAGAGDEVARLLAALPPPAADDPALAETLRRLPIPTAPLRSERLGGTHNAVYRLDADGRAYALRLGRYPAVQWDLYAEEAANMRAAHAAGLAPEPLYADLADGTLLTPFARGRVLDDAALLDHAVVARVGEMYARLHGMGGMIGRYDLAGDLDRLEAGAGGGEPVAGLAELRARLAEIRAVLAANAVPAAPCHNDPVPVNMVDDGRRVMLLDWQCSGYGDPDWEVGALAALAWLDPEHRHTLYAARYGDADCPRAERAELYRPVCRWFWTLTALERRRHGHPETEWGEQLQANLGELRAMLAEPELPARLKRLGGWCSG
jgi:tetratricopeptide (TPR) repeat protein